MTIVVVGHGRSPEGKRWGSRIDCCTTVVRCWDWDWQDPVDTGVMYHYGLFVLTPKGLDLFNRYVNSVPTRGWLAYFGKPTPGLLPGGGGVSVEILDNERWNKLAIELGGMGESGKFTLTRGCAAACWAIEKAAKSKERVILVGFDNVWLGTNQSAEKSFSPKYWNHRFVEDKYTIGQPKTATHDMSVERPLLESLAKTNDVELKLAQEVW